MEDKESARRGRPSAFSPRQEKVITIHLNLGVEIWAALRDYCEEMDERYLSIAVRKILRARLTELGYVKEKIRLLPSPSKNP